MSIWKLHITTKDLWTGKRGIEIVWDEKLLFVRGFGEHKS